MPLFAFIEACVGIGLFVSGAFLLIIAVALYSNDVAPITLIATLAMLGAILGDHVGYYVGLWFGPRFHHTKLAARNRGRVERAEKLIRRYGAWVIFIGRFIPAIRSLIPAALGVSGFDRWRYTLLDILACALWSIALAAIVLGLGAAV